MYFFSILKHVKNLLKHKMMLIIQKILNLKCLFHGKVIRFYNLLFYPSKKSVNFYYKKVFLIFFQEGFVRVILKIILVNNVLLVVDLISQEYMILDIMTTQLWTNFRSDPLEEMCKVLQENLMKYVMNLCRNEENKMSLKKFIVALVVGQVRDYWL